jgi:hypothetical protein
MLLCCNLIGFFPAATQLDFKQCGDRLLRCIPQWKLIFDFRALVGQK